MRILIAVLTLLLVSSMADAELLLQIGELGDEAGPLPYLFDYEKRIMTIDVHVLGWSGDPAGYVSLVQGAMFLWGADASRFTPCMQGRGATYDGETGQYIPPAETLADRTVAELSAMVAPKAFALSDFDPSSRTNAANGDNCGRFGLVNETSGTGPLAAEMPAGSVIMRFAFSWQGDAPFTEIIPVLGDYSLQPGSKPAVLQDLTRLPVSIVNQGVAPLWPEDLDLQNAHMDVTTPRNFATLQDASIRITTGGINTLAARGESSVQMVGGYIKTGTVEDGGTVEISGGSVTESLSVTGSGRLSVSGGEHATLSAKGTTIADVTGGSISRLVASDDARLAVSGGQLATLSLGGRSQTQVQGGTIGVLDGNGEARFTLHGGPTVGKLTLRDSASGQVAGGNVGDVLLYNDSRLDITGGQIGLKTYGNSRVTVGGDAVVTGLTAADESSVTFAGGSSGTIWAQGNSVVALTGVRVEPYMVEFGAIVSSGTSRVLLENVTVNLDGFGYGIYACDSSIMEVRNSVIANAPVYASETSLITLYSGTYYVRGIDQGAIEIHGGTLSSIRASDKSTIRLHGTDFAAGEGLTLTLFDTIDGVPQYRVTGTGYLSGTWFDGTPWSTNIATNDTTANLLAVPEPATLGLLGLGLGWMAIRRRGAGRQRGR